MKDTCKSCAHYDPFEDQNQGLCRASLPTVSSEGYGRWPEVGEEDWCGQHQEVRTAPPVPGIETI